MTKSDDYTLGATKQLPCVATVALHLDFNLFVDSRLPILGLTKNPR